MKLSGKDKKLLDEALILAFPEYEKLKKMVRYQLEENLEKIVKKDNIDDVVFDLTNWAEEQEELQRLIEGAFEENPSNQKLKYFYETIFPKYFPVNQFSPNTVISSEQNNELQHLTKESSNKSQNHPKFIFQSVIPKNYTVNLSQFNNFPYPEQNNEPTDIFSDIISSEQKSELIDILSEINYEILQIICRATLKNATENKDIEEDFPEMINEWKNLRPLKNILLENYPLRKDNIPTIVEFAERLTKAKEVDESEKIRIQEWLEKIANEKNINLPTYVDEPQLYLTQIKPHLLITIEQLPKNFCLQAELISNNQLGENKPESLPIYFHKNEFTCYFHEIKDEIYEFIKKAKDEIDKKYRCTEDKLTIELFHKVKYSAEYFDLEEISLGLNELKNFEYQYQFTVSCLEQDLINQSTNFGEFLNQFLTRWDLFKAFLKENSTNKNEEYQEVEGTDFQKINNLYSWYTECGPVKDKEMFYGQDKLIDNFTSSICNSPSAKNFVIYGQKCTGKSSILYHLEQRLKPQIIPVLFSIGGMDNFSDATFLYRIIQEIEKAFDKLTTEGYPSIYVQRPDLEKMQDYVQIRFENYMSDLSKQLRKIDEYRNAKLMLLIDDFSYIYAMVKFRKDVCQIHSCSFGRHC